MSLEGELCYINNKGGIVLLTEGYYKVKNFKNGAALWRLSSYKNKKCCGNIIIMDNKVTKKKEHTCVPNTTRNIILQELEILKETVKINPDPVPQLYQKAVEKMKNNGLDKVGTVPTLSSIQHNLYNIRNKALSVTKTVYRELDEVSVPLQFQQDILAEYRDEDSLILIFCIEQARKQIQSIKEYFGDATFDSCPVPLYQLYIIHGDFGSTITGTKTVPLIYVLMSDKKEITYNIMFQLIKRQLPNFKPEKFHCDFEKAGLNAISDIYPQVEVKGCYYHWTRAVWKMDKKLGLKSKSDKRIIGLTAVLPLLPEDYINEGLQYIKSESSSTPKRIKFFKYVEGFWLTRYFNKILSVFSERHRTNNVAEAFHSKLRKLSIKETPQFCGY